MLKQALLCTALIAAAMATTAGAQQPQPGPGIDDTTAVTAAESRPGPVDPAVLTTITAWLSDNFGLPAANPADRTRAAGADRRFSLSRIRSTTDRGQQRWRDARCRTRDHGRL